MNDFVFIESEGVIGKVIHHGAYASRVIFASGGLVFDIYVDNEELCPAEEFFKKYEESDNS